MTLLPEEISRWNRFFGYFAKSALPDFPRVVKWHPMVLRVRNIIINVVVISFIVFLQLDGNKDILRLLEGRLKSFVLEKGRVA